MSAGRSTERTRREFLRRVGLVVGGLLVGLLMAEGVVRLVSRVDSAGQRWVFEWQLRPYRLQVEHARELMDAYLASDTSYQMYDPDLGWTLRPDSQSVDGLYRANGQGLRADRDYDLEPADGVLRIALFGDSNTHGSDVAYEESWGYLLEQGLNEAGVRAEVLNFGVGGYGMDQAYLRWLKDGQAFQPDIVLFGFRARNVQRNVNVVRSVYNPRTGNPFTKPRFILDGDQLVLVNSPTVAPEAVVGELEHFGSSPLAEYEYFLSDDCRATWWTSSRLAALLVAVIEGPTGDVEQPDEALVYALDGDFAPLAIAIIDAFGDDVAEHGAVFMVIELPHQRDLLYYSRQGNVSYESMFEDLAGKHMLIRTVEGFNLDRIDRYYAGHYSAEGNQVIAEQATDFILNWLDVDS